MFIFIAGGRGIKIETIFRIVFQGFSRNNMGGFDSIPLCILEIIISFATQWSKRKDRLSVMLVNKIWLNVSRRMVHPGGTLYYAVIKNNIDIVKIILEDKKIDISYINNIHFRKACEYGRTEIVKEFLKDKRIESFAENNEAFQMACYNGHLDVVKELLKDERIDPSERDNFAIKAAGIHNHFEIVREILKDSRISNLWEVFKRACISNRLEFIKELLKDPRVDPSMEDNFAIKFSSKYGYLEIVNELLKDPRVVVDEEEKYCKRII